MNVFEAIWAALSARAVQAERERTAASWASRVDAIQMTSGEPVWGEPGWEGCTT